MSRPRLITLSLGVIALAFISWWRLAGDRPQLPERPEELRQSGAHDSAPNPDPTGVLAFAGRTMGTTYSVKYVPPHSGVLGMPEVVTESALSAVNESMSTYDPDSEISIINRARAGTRVVISPDLLQVLTLSMRVHEETRGAFDITVGPLVSLYGFGATPAKGPPDEEVLSAMKQRIGMNLLEVRPEERSVQKRHDGVELDLSGVAKGFGVDQVAAELEKLEVVDYMVEVGGEIRVRGKKPDGSPWKLAIEEPTPLDRKLHATLVLPEGGGALATSGDYRNFRRIGQRVVSHTFDPRTRQPTPRRTASVSVVRPTAAEADALATALSVLTPDEALELSNQQGWAVYLLVHSMTLHGKGQERPSFVASASDEFKKLTFHRVGTEK